MDERRQAIIDRIETQRGIAVRSAEKAEYFEDEASKFREYIEKAPMYLGKIAARHEEQAKQHRDAESKALAALDHAEADLKAYDESLTLEQRIAALEEQLRIANGR